MKTKCVIFDADWVIINSEMFSVEYEKQFGIPSLEMLPFFKWIFSKCIIWEADLKEVIEPYLKKWKWDWNVDQFLQFWFKTEHKIDNKIVFIIEKLRQKWVICCLATNQEKYRFKYIKENMWFEKIFDHLFSSCDIGYKKPEKEFFEFILGKIKNDYSIESHEIMFFDDSKWHIDIAKSLSIDAYFYDDFEKFEKLVKPII